MIAATIAALPLVVQTLQVSIAAIAQEIQEAARIDGCNRWQMLWHIDLPLIWRGLLAGGVLGFLRAMGDFGITLMVAGNIPGSISFSSSSRLRFYTLRAGHRPARSV